MKITNVECIPVQAPGRTLVAVVVETDEGIAGVGEAGLQRRWAAIGGAVEHLRRWLVGEDPFRIEDLWQRMYRGGFYPADRIIGSAAAGIDMALWDIKGKALGVPVYELLGGRCRDYVQCFLSPTYRPGDDAPARRETDCKETMTGFLHDADAVVACARDCAAAGHRYFRLGPPKSAVDFEPRAALRVLARNLRAVREALGWELELMTDLHAECDPMDALWFLREVEDLGLFCVEDPLRSEYMQGYRQIRAHTNTPLAAGEQWCSKWEFRQAIEEDLIDFARIDIAIAGGLTEAKKIAAMAEAHYIKILPHNPLGPVNTAAALHLDLACNNAGPQEVIFPPATMLPDVFVCDFRLDGTRLTLPTAPGIGVTFDRDAAAEHPPDYTEPPHYRRTDGQFTNY